VVKSSGTETPFGDVLREARKACGVSLHEISNSTKISRATLKALECEDIGHLPGGIFTRSFVRSYADAVGLDPEETLRKFLERFPSDDGSETRVRMRQGGSYDEFHSHREMARTVVGLALLSAPLIGLLVYFGMSSAGDDRAETAELSGTVAVPDLNRTRAITPPVAQSVGATARTPPPPVQGAAALGPLTIDIHPNADCWVSATVDGERLFSRVMRAGDREVFEADAEIVVNVGDAGAFAFAINQRPGRLLGTPGQVVTARINRENYRSFVTE